MIPTHSFSEFHAQTMYAGLRPAGRLSAAMHIAGGTPALNFFSAKIFLFFWSVGSARFSRHRNSRALARAAAGPAATLNAGETPAPLRIAFFVTTRTLNPQSKDFNLKSMNLKPKLVAGKVSAAPLR